MEINCIRVKANVVYFFEEVNLKRQYASFVKS